LPEGEGFGRLPKYCQSSTNRHRAKGFTTCDEEHIDTRVAQHEAGSSAHPAFSRLLYTGQQTAFSLPSGQLQRWNGMIRTKDCQT